MWKGRRRTESRVRNEPVCYAGEGSDNMTVKDSEYMKRGDSDILGFSVFLPSI